MGTCLLYTSHGKRVFLFGTAGFGGSAPYFEKILAATRKALDGSNTVIGSFMCQDVYKRQGGGWAYHHRRYWYQRQ